MCSEHKLYIRIMLTYAFNLILLLHHTAGDTDDHSVTLLILMLKSPHTAVQLLVCILSYRTGREKHDVRIPVIFSGCVAALLKDSEKLLAVLGRHLASHNFNHTMSLVAFLLLDLNKLTYPVHKVVLSCGLLSRCLFNYFLVIDNVFHKTSLLIPGDENPLGFCKKINFLKH